MDPTQALVGAIVLLGAAIGGAALARLPRSAIRAPLYAFVLAGVLWAFGDWVAEGARDTTSKQIGVAILYTGSIVMPALWWIIALRWADEAGAVLPLRSRAWRWLPLAWAGAMWGVMITNPWHGAFMTPVVGGPNVYRPFWFAMALPNYGLVLAALVVEIGVARRVRRPAVRRQAAFLIAASGVTLAGNLAYVTGFAHVNLTAVVLSISIALLLVGMAREGLFGVMPAAMSAIAADHPDGIIVIGSDGYVAFANRRAHELLAPVPLRPDRPFLEILRNFALQPEPSLPTGPDADRQWWRVLGTPTGVFFQLRDGHAQRWLQVVASPIGDDSSARGRLLHLHDATARRQAELHAGQQRRLESVAALALSVSRDFQGAFAIVRGNADLLERELEGDPVQRHLARIFEATRVGSNLAQELQLYAGSIHSVHTTLDLSHAATQTCDWIGSELPPGVRLLRRLASRLLPVEADPIQLRDCVFHLLQNAVEATAECGGRVEVSTGVERVDPSTLEPLVWGRDEPPGDFAYVRVRDEGGGMDEETEERAFEPFFSTRHKDRGSGLSAVLGIARAHDALLALHNDSGKGCSFALYLRLIPPAPTPPVR